MNTSDNSERIKMENPPFEYTHEQEERAEREVIKLMKSCGRGVESRNWRDTTYNWALRHKDLSYEEIIHTTIAKNKFYDECDELKHVCNLEFAVEQGLISIQTMDDAVLYGRVHQIEEKPERVLKVYGDQLSYPAKEKLNEALFEKQRMKLCLRFYSAVFTLKENLGLSYEENKLIDDLPPDEGAQRILDNCGLSLEEAVERFEATGKILE